MYTRIFDDVCIHSTYPNTCINVMKIVTNIKNDK